jgi:hypothetical protein
VAAPSVAAQPRPPPALQSAQRLYFSRENFAGATSALILARKTAWANLPRAAWSEAGITPNASRRLDALLPFA